MSAKYDLKSGVAKFGRLELERWMDRGSGETMIYVQMGEDEAHGYLISLETFNDMLGTIGLTPVEVAPS